MGVKSKKIWQDKRSKKIAKQERRKKEKEALDSKRLCGRTHYEAFTICQWKIRSTVH